MIAKQVCPGMCSEIIRPFATQAPMSAVSYASLNWNNDLNEARRDFYSNPGTDKLRWRAMAYVERQNGNCDNARSLYEEYLRIDPDSLVIYNDLASLEVSLKNYEEACHIYEHMLEVDSSNVLAIKGLMYIYRILGKEDKLKQLIDHSQNIVSIQDNLGYTLEIAKNSYMEGKIELARDYFIQCSKNEYSWKYIFLEWSSMEYKYGHKEAAIHVLFNGIQLMLSHEVPIPTRMYHMLGLYLQDQGRFEEAEVCYDRGTKTSPSPYLCWKEWAKLHLFKGNWPLCNQMYLYALSQMKDEPGLWLSYIAIIEKTNHAPLLPLVLKEAYQQCPDSNRIQQKYISYQLSSGKDEEAKQLLRQYIQQFPKDIFGYLTLANKYRKENDIEHAQQLYYEALDLPTGKEKVLQELAQLYITEKKYDQAHQCLIKALNIKKDIVILKELATLEMNLENYSKALEYLQEALNSNAYQRTKEMAQIYACKAKVLLKLNRMNESEDAYLDSLRINKYNIPIVLNYCDDILIKQKRWKEVIQLLNKGLEVDRVGTFKSDMNERLLYALKQSRKENK